MGTTAWGPNKEVSIAEQLEKQGNWAWFPEDPSLWSRSSEPFDFQVDESRWLAEPTQEGSIRCRVENDEPDGNAGFYLNLGEVGDLETIHIDAHSVESAGNVAELLVAVYFDINDDGGYFEWQQSEEGTEHFDGLGQDVEGLASGLSTDGLVTIDAETEFVHVPSLDPDDFYPVTFGEYVAGNVKGVESNTTMGLQISVLGGGSGTIEEAVIDQINIEKG